MLSGFLHAGSGVGATSGAGTLSDRVVKRLLQAPATRDDLCRDFGVSRTTLVRAISELLESHFIESVPPSRPHSGGRGRPVHVLRVNDQAVYAVGIEVTRATARGVLVDCAGRPLLHRTISVATDESWLQCIQRICVRLAHDGEEENLETAHVAGVGIGVPFPLSPLIRDGETQPVALSDSVVQCVQRIWKAPVIINNVVAMSALGEMRWGAGKAHERQLFVQLDSGIGCCWSGYDPVTGSERSVMGEIGHIAVAGAHEACHCGKKGCLETVAGIPAVMKRAGVEKPAELARRVASGDPSACALVEQVGRAVGVACADAIALMNPQVVICGGTLVREIPQVVDSIREACAESLIPAVQWDVSVVPAQLDQWGPARGAVAAVLGALRQRRAHSVLRESL